MSVLNSLVRTVLLVKIYLEVTDASVNPDILDETVKLVSFVLGFEISLGTVTSSCLHLNLFNHSITKISPFLKSTSLYFAVR